jgi:hypothetical protein
MTPHDLALVFLNKAAQDETVLAKLVDDPEISDEVVGFHAQQASEKLLKALLTNVDVEAERTHNLARLIRAVENAGFALPGQLKRLDALTPVAVELRYGIFPSDMQMSIGRPEMFALVRQLRKWVEKRVKR